MKTTRTVILSFLRIEEYHTLLCQWLKYFVKWFWCDNYDIKSSSRLMVVAIVMVKCELFGFDYNNAVKLPWIFTEAPLIFNGQNGWHFQIRLCVCVCERERETDRQTDGQRDGQTDRQTEMMYSDANFSDISSQGCNSINNEPSLFQVMAGWVLNRQK